ncbi:hypothetical protein [Streptomyces sp. Y7]|uniref:hypothetical protein n=1 Tax=Streptomyces sp. Y7 TaxID=3342392 RepID=UPI00371B9C15
MTRPPRLARPRRSGLPLLVVGLAVAVAAITAAVGHQVPTSAPASPPASFSAFAPSPEPRTGAIDQNCPRRYADPTQDPRTQQ